MSEHRCSKTDAINRVLNRDDLTEEEKRKQIKKIEEAFETFNQKVKKSMQKMSSKSMLP